MGAITPSIPRDHRATKGSCCRSAVNVSSVGNGLCSPSINPRTMPPPPASKDTARYRLRRRLHELLLSAPRGPNPPPPPAARALGGPRPRLLTGVEVAGGLRRAATMGAGAVHVFVVTTLRPGPGGFRTARGRSARD